MKQRIAASILLLFLAAALAGCGSTPPPVETTQPAPATTAPAETVVSPEEYLDSARALLADGDRDAAIALLEQALAETEDARLRELLEELTAPVPLVLEYTDRSGGAVTVHSFTAEETYTRKVRYTLDYTAPEGLTVMIVGGLLNHTLPDFTTTGQRGQLVFEVDAQDILRMKGELQVRFRPSEGVACVLDVKTLWPEQIQSTFEISYLMMDHNRTGNALVHSFLLRDDGERCHFTVGYTAVEGLEVTGKIETPEVTQSFWEEPFLTEGGVGTLEFDIDKALLADGKYMEVCFTDESGNWVAAGFDFPLRLRRTLEQPQTDPVYPGWLPSSGWGAEFEVHDCYYQPLSNGYVRFTLDITTPGGCFVSILAMGGGDEVQDQYLSLPGRQQYVSDIPLETLASCRSLSVLVAKPGSLGRYLEIPCGAFACSDAAPVAEPTGLECRVSGMDASLLSATVEPLDNGSLRYTLTVQAEESLRAAFFDPPNGERLSVLFLSEPVEGIHTFCFDVEADIASSLTEIGFTGSFDGNRTVSATILNAIPEISAPPVPVEILSCS